MRVIAVMGSVLLIGVVIVIVLVVAGIPDGPLRNVVDPKKVPSVPGFRPPKTAAKGGGEADGTSSAMYITLQLAGLVATLIALSAIIANRKTITAALRGLFAG